MDTAASSGFQFQLRSGQGYAIPIDRALAVATQIEAGRPGKGVHIGATPFLGIDVQSPAEGFNANPSSNGALVVAVVPSSPAQRAGLSEGDLITSLAGRKIASFSQITGLILGFAPGATVKLRWLDQTGATHSVNLRLVSGPPQ
jgi:S1-C subfamily serine protease